MAAQPIKDKDLSIDCRSHVYLFADRGERPCRQLVYFIIIIIIIIIIINYCHYYYYYYYYYYHYYDHYYYYQIIYVVGKIPAPEYVMVEKGKKNTVLFEVMKIVL